MLEVGKGGLPPLLLTRRCPYLEHADSVGVPESLAGYTVDLALKQHRDFLPKRKELCQFWLPGDQVEELFGAELHFYLWQRR